MAARDRRGPQQDLRGEESPQPYFSGLLSPRSLLLLSGLVLVPGDMLGKNQAKFCPETPKSTTSLARAGGGGQRLSVTGAPLDFCF